MTTQASEALAALRQQFKDQLPARLQALRALYGGMDPQAWSAAGAEALHRQVHGLTGSAGTFGMQSLSVLARELEQQIAALMRGVPAQAALAADDRARWQAVGETLGRLERLAQARLDSNAPSLAAPAERPQPVTDPLVYVVEDDLEQAGHMQRVLQEAGFRVRHFSQPAEFRAAMATPGQARPHAVVMDMIFPEGEDVGIHLMRELGLGQASGLPVVVVSVRDDMSARLQAFRAGASRYLVKPVGHGQLVDLMDALTGRLPPEPYRVMMVDDDALLLEAQATVLRAAGMEVHTLTEPLQVLQAMKGFRPDVVVLDMYMPEASGPELAAILRERDTQLHLPILFLSAESDLSQQLAALNLGGDDFLVKPVQPEHLIAAVTARARRSRQSMAIRRRLETTLYEREREHLALDHHAIVSVADATGRITYINDKFCEISGYSRAELLGQNHRIVKSGEHPHGFYDDMWRTIASGQVWQGEVCNRRKDGGLYWVESTITPFLDDHGLPYQYVSMRTDITHIKAAEQSLAASADRLNATLESTQDGILAVGPQGEVLFMNRHFRELWNMPETMEGRGGSDGELLAHAMQQLVDPSGFMERVEALYRSEDVSDDLIELADGRIFERHSQPLRGQGRVVGRVWSFHDITERRRAEQAAEAAKERLRRGQMYANIGTWEWNIVTGDLYWTERIAPLFGYPLGDLETSYGNFLAAVHPDDRQAVTDAVAACVERDAPYEIEHRVVWPDGTVRWLLERGAVQRDATGKPLNMIGVVQDIDDRKRAELALAERERQLLEAQGLASIGNWTANVLTGELVWSDQIYRIFGHEPGSFVPSVAAFHAAVHPDDQELIRESERRAEQTGRHDVTHRIVRPDGSVRHVHELAQAETDASGRLVRMTGTVQDVTERVAFEQALVAAREAADRANQAKSEFLSSMSHELRTPLNAILGFGQLMELDETLPADQQDNVHEIIKAGRHLLDLINEVLDLAKVESGRIDLSMEAVELQPLVEECRMLLQPLAEQRGIGIQIADATGYRLRTDRTRLKQVLLNLLSNAVKYNRDNGRVTLEVQLQAPTVLRLAVRDTGRGIPADRLQELFQPFNRLGADRSDIEGTGIGLTITRRIVELMGGEVGVESEVGVGSVFWIDLPLLEAPATVGGTAPAAVAARAMAAPAPQADEHARTLLYIEDNPANLKLVAQMLGRRPDIRLRTAHLPSLGIELALALRPDLILLDINMPDMDGYQVLEVLKSDPALRRIPVVALTANAMPRDIERGMAAGFDDYLTKPLLLERFLQVIDTHFNDRAPAPTDPKEAPR